MRANATSRHLALSDAVEIWRRRSEGEAQHKIAANQGRISEILSGRGFSAAKRLAQSTTVVSDRLKDGAGLESLSENQERGPRGHR